MQYPQPTGIEFYDAARGKMLILVTEGPFKDWICYQHVDGGWVTLREATEDDKRRIEIARRDGK
jgi:hypothetical protein